MARVFLGFTGRAGRHLAVELHSMGYGRHSLAADNSFFCCVPSLKDGRVGAQHTCWLALLFFWTAC